MTDAVYQLVRKALLRKKAEVKASPAAAKKFLEASGLGDVLESAASRKSSKVIVTKKSKRKRIPA